MVNETHKTLLTNIRNQMARHKIDVPALARILGMSESGAYKILAGAAEPALEYLERFAAYTKLSVADLFGEPVAQRRPTLHEAIRVIEETFQAIINQPDLSRVPSDLLSILTTAGDPEFRAIREALEGTAVGKEAAKTLRNKGLKRKNSSVDRP